MEEDDDNKEHDTRRRRRLEGVIPDLLKRAVEIGVERASEAPESIRQFVGDLKLPKELAGYIFSQVEETKNGLFRVVAKEMREFLEHTNFAGEMQKILTTVQFEVNTTIRFTPNEGKTEGGEDAAGAGEKPTTKMPEVKMDVFTRRGGERRERKKNKEG